MVDLTSKCISFFPSCPYMANLGRCLIFSCHWDKSPHQIFLPRFLGQLPTDRTQVPLFATFSLVLARSNGEKSFIPPFKKIIMRGSGCWKGFRTGPPTYCMMCCWPTLAKRAMIENAIFMLQNFCLEERGRAQLRLWLLQTRIKEAS